MPSPVLSRVVLRPFALASRPQELPVAAACILALALVSVGDVATPVQVALSALGLIPLLTAMCSSLGDRPWRGGPLPSASCSSPGS